MGARANGGAGLPVRPFFFGELGQLYIYMSLVASVSESSDRVWRINRGAVRSEKIYFDPSRQRKSVIILDRPPLVSLSNARPVYLNRSFAANWPERKIGGVTYLAGRTWEVGGRARSLSVISTGTGGRLVGEFRSTTTTTTGNRRTTDRATSSVRRAPVNYSVSTVRSRRFRRFSKSR